MNAALIVRLPHLISRSAALPFESAAGRGGHQMHHVIADCPADSAENPAAWRRFGPWVVQQDDALAGASSRSISSQFLLRRHRVPVAGPKVGAEHHDAARLQQVERRPASISKPGKRKNGVLGVVVATPWSAISTAEMPWSISSAASSGLIRIRLDAARCGVRWYGLRPRSCAPAPDVPTAVCRSGRTWRARIRAASAASTRGSWAGHGPSSKVSTTS